MLKKKLNGSLITLSKDGQVIDTIRDESVNNLSKDKSMRHNGPLGDSESITISLREVSQEVDSIWIVFSLPNKAHSFTSDVKNAYCRLFDDFSESQFCRFDLSIGKDILSNGNIIGYLKRQEGVSNGWFSNSSSDKWSFTAKGYYTRGAVSAIGMI